MANLNETQQVKIKGQYSTAEVTHVLEAIKLEGQCYIKNHLLMNLAGEAETPIREWHDNVTRRNLDALKGVAKEMGLDLPFPTPLEERENQLKESVKGAKVQGILKPGEALLEVKTAGVYLDNFYTVSLNLATNDKIRDVFRRSRETVAENIPRVVTALMDTDHFYPPPIAKEIGYVAEKGVSPKKS